MIFASFNAYSIEDLMSDCCWSLCVPALTLAITDELLDFRAFLFLKWIPCGKNFQKNIPKYMTLTLDCMKTNRVTYDQQLYDLGL